MTKPETEKLPEPAFRLKWDSMRAAYYVSKPNIGDTDVYTADQMRAYALAAVLPLREELKKWTALVDTHERLAELNKRHQDRMDALRAQVGGFVGPEPCYCCRCHPTLGDPTATPPATAPCQRTTPDAAPDAVTWNDAFNGRGPMPAPLGLCEFRKSHDWRGDGKCESCGAEWPDPHYFASGPEGSFFATSLAEAENLIDFASFDRDEWTVTDLHDPNIAHARSAGGEGNG